VRVGGPYNDGMQWLTWLLFESVVALGIVLGVTLFVLLVYWRRTGRARPIQIGLVLATGLLILQSAVTTRREHALQTMQVVERALLEARASDLAPVLADDFEAGGRKRDEFIRYVGEWLQRERVRLLERYQPQVEDSEDERFTLRITYSAELTGDYRGNLPSTWALKFVWTPNGWRIGDIQPIMIAGMDEATWGSIERH
jgi:hypothetical protein